MFCKVNLIKVELEKGNPRECKVIFNKRDNKSTGEKNCCLFKKGNPRECKVIFNKRDNKTTGKKTAVFFFFLSFFIVYSISIDRGFDVSPLN